MFKFMKRDPVEKAKKHIAKALEEIEEGYPDYASTEYEKAARLFLEVDQVEFAVKYFREAAYWALDCEDYIRAGDMKLAAAEALLTDGSFVEAAGLLSEASDHYHRENKFDESIRFMSVSVLCLLAARSFDSAVNFMRKLEKRIATKKKVVWPKAVSMLKMAKYSVAILCEGEIVPVAKFDAVVEKLKLRETEEIMFQFLVDSIRLALKTEIVIEWAGPEPKEVTVKTPLEFELRYKCPVPVRVVDCRHSLSSSLTLSRDQSFKREASMSESWLLEVTPVLSGKGEIGPYKLTLEGDKVLVHKVSNVLKFGISLAPSDLTMSLSPSRISCDLGDEAILDVEFYNIGDGPANNIKVMIVLSDGLELSMGGEEKVIQFLGSQEKMRFQLFVRGVGLGEETITIKATDGRSGKEISKTSIIEVI